MDLVERFLEAYKDAVELHAASFTNGFPASEGLANQHREALRMSAALIMSEGQYEAFYNAAEEYDRYEEEIW